MQKAMMEIKEVNPSECFTGVDRDGWWNYPNLFHCPKCDYGVYFNQQSLEKGSVNQQKQPLKLSPEDSALFVSNIQRFISDKPERFILDFYCPQCHRAYVIGFETHEFHMSHYRYRPVVVFSSAE
jgi:hypothetical protein